MVRWTEPAEIMAKSASKASIASIHGLNSGAFGLDCDSANVI